MAYCYFSGRCIPEVEATLSIHTLGVQRGFGIFDLFRARNGVPTFLEDHLQRFDNSQRFLGLKELVSRDEITRAVAELQTKNQFSNSTFKLMLLGGGSESDEALEPLFYIVNTPLDVEAMPKVGSLITHEYVREYPTIKSVNYFTSNLLHKRKKSMGAVDVLYHHDGIISEASRSNVFIVKNGRVATPEKNILSGVTRKHILKIAEAHYELSVGDISLDELRDADEVFISSTLKEVMPIHEIDGKKIGDGITGMVSRDLLERFHAHVLDYKY